MGALAHFLTTRLEEEIFELHPENKDYRPFSRSILANLKRNTGLTGSYSAGRIPPQWIVRSDAFALAKRNVQLHRRIFRSECMKEAKLDDRTSAFKRHCDAAGKGRADF